MNRDQEMTPERRAWLQAEMAKLEAARHRKNVRESKGPLSAYDIMERLTNFRVYTDAAGNAWFHWTELPKALRDKESEKNQPHFQCLVPIPSKKLRSLLVTWLHREDIALEPGAIDEVLAVLEGLAFLNPERCELETAIEINPVLEALLALLETEPDWEGTATEPLAALAKLSSEREWHFERQPNWPQNAGALSRSLAKLEPYLREAGFLHEFHRFEKRRRHNFRLISVTNNQINSRRSSIKMEQSAIAASRSDSPSVPSINAAEIHSNSAPEFQVQPTLTHDANDDNDGIFATEKMSSCDVPSASHLATNTSECHDDNDANDGIFAIASETA